MKQAILFITISIFGVITPTSCKKYLETKADASFAIPSSLSDIRALLDNNYLMRRGISGTQTGSDEYYLPANIYSRYSTEMKDTYIWKADLNLMSDWSIQYEDLLLINTILDNLPKISNKGVETEYDQLYGEALFHRAQKYYQLAQLYSPQFDVSSANQQLGLVLRLNSDFNEPSRRASNKDSYDQIINDLVKSTELLQTTTQYNTRPNKPAAYGLLSRIYLQIGEWEKARDAATNCLNLYNTLINYNDPAEIDTLQTEPFLNLNIKNKEVIYFLNEESSLSTSSRAVADTNLFKLYAINDLRRPVFFSNSAVGPGLKRFRGSYSGSISMGNFVGVGTAEIYLIRSESNARLGDVDVAINDLNHLLENRYKTGTFTPLAASNSNQALELILLERRKEMFLRGIRWGDLKRLNKEPGREITLTRDISGQIYTLQPNDNRYTLLIPREVMQYANIHQNPR